MASKKREEASRRRGEEASTAREGEECEAGSQHEGLREALDARSRELDARGKELKEAEKALAKLRLQHEASTNELSETREALVGQRGGPSERASRGWPSARP